MASLTFDPAGGVNLLYARCAVGPVGEESPVSIGYARWRNASELGTTPYFKARFSDPFTGLLVGAENNDYHMITSTSCVVHAAYVSPQNGVDTVKYRRVVVHCSIVADLNTDTLVDPIDAGLFATYFIGSDPRADVTHDGAVNSGDIVLFNESVACACNP
jgi:hypothetical protein